MLCHHEYPLQGLRSKGLLRAYAEHLTGLSRAQSTRLSGAYVKAGRIAPKPSLRPRFQRHYTADDVELLASVDRAHERLSGQATHPSGQRPSAGDTSRRPTPRPSTSSTPASSTPTSTTTGPRPRPKSRSTTRDANGDSTRSGKPVREAALTRPATAVPAPRTLDRRTQTRGRNHQRHRGCPAHAAGKKQHVRADKQVGVNPALKWKRLWK